MTVVFYLVLSLVIYSFLYYTSKIKTCNVKILKISIYYILKYIELELVLNLPPLSLYLIFEIFI